MTTKQPEALRLADQMLHYWDERGPDAEEVAAELRRLHDLLGKANALNRIRSESIAALDQSIRQALAELKDARLRNALHILQNALGGPDA